MLVSLTNFPSTPIPQLSYPQLHLIILWFLWVPNPHLIITYLSYYIINDCLYPLILTICCYYAHLARFFSVTGSVIVPILKEADLESDVACLETYRQAVRFQPMFSFMHFHTFPYIFTSWNSILGLSPFSLTPLTEQTHQFFRNHSHENVYSPWFFSPPEFQTFPICFHRKGYRMSQV